MNLDVLGEHEVTACCFFTLGLVQSDLGGDKGALVSLQKAAEMTFSLLGAHKNTACSYFNLGRVLYEMGDHKRASEVLHQAANMYSSLLGDHVDTALSYLYLQFSAAFGRPMQGCFGICT